MAEKLKGRHVSMGQDINRVRPLNLQKNWPKSRQKSIF